MTEISVLRGVVRDFMTIFSVILGVYIMELLDMYISDVARENVPIFSVY